MVHWVLAYSYFGFWKKKCVIEIPCYLFMYFVLYVMYFTNMRFQKIFFSALLRYLLLNLFVLWESWYQKAVEIARGNSICILWRVASGAKDVSDPCYLKGQIPRHYSQGTFCVVCNISMRKIELGSCMLHSKNFHIFESDWHIQEKTISI